MARPNSNSFYRRPRHSTRGLHAARVEFFKEINAMEMTALEPGVTRPFREFLQKGSWV
jgi:hypothetical protein